MQALYGAVIPGLRMADALARDLWRCFEALDRFAETRREVGYVAGDSEESLESCVWALGIRPVGALLSI